MLYRFVVECLIGLKPTGILLFCVQSDARQHLPVCETVTQLRRRACHLTDVVGLIRNAQRFVTMQQLLMQLDATSGLFSSHSMFDVLCRRRLTLVDRCKL
jgi:hypothetical protein